MLPSIHCTRMRSGYQISRLVFNSYFGAMCDIVVRVFILIDNFIAWLHAVSLVIGAGIQTNMKLTICPISALSVVVYLQRRFYCLPFYAHCIVVVYVPFIYVVPFEREITAQLVEEELFDNGFFTGQSIPRGNGGYSF